MIGAVGSDALGVVESLDEQTAIRVHNVLEGERVVLRRRRRKKGFQEAELVEVVEPSPHRVEPACSHFGVCGGCALQHVSPAHQLKLKEQWYRAQITAADGVSPERWLAPLSADQYRYRRRARLGVKAVAAKGRVLVGFRERFMPYVADTTHCEILAGGVGELLLPLAEMIAKLSISDRLPQIEVAVADDATALVFRVLDPPTDADLEILQAFESDHGLSLYLQTGGPDTIRTLSADSTPLSYRLEADDLTIRFEPTDFVQVNGSLNQRMIALTMDLLRPSPTDRVLDLFCGLGNFSLPLAKRVAEVVAVEGDAALVDRARDNAQRNRVHNVRFFCADLFETNDEQSWRQGRFDAVLLDPPRSGAEKAVAMMTELGPSRLVYVSCNTATLVRDAGLLCAQGYRFVATGIMDMFPQTRHAEAIALFERDDAVRYSSTDRTGEE